MSIDRRSFVQSAVIAAGGAAAGGGEAAAREGIQLAQAAATPLPLSLPSTGPYKPTNYDVWAQVAIYDAFVAKIFADMTYRAQFTDPNKTWTDLYNLIKNDLGLDIGSGTKIFAVDIQTGATNVKGQNDNNPIDPSKDRWYTLILPPLPVKNPGNTAYMEAMKGEAAWHHTVVEGYGM